MPKRSTKVQHDVFAAVERRWATLAEKEGKYNLTQSKKFRTQGENVLADAYEQEYGWDMFWARRRRGLAKLHERLAHPNCKHPEHNCVCKKRKVK